MSTAASAGSIVLVGMAGSGKTSVGRRLAERLGRRFVDVDDLVTQRAGTDVASIFRTEGEPGFRAREAEAFDEIADRLTGPGVPMVVATGGGAPTTAGVRERLEALAAAGVTIVWLRTDEATLLERLGDGAGRPLLEGDAAARVRELAVERAPVYASCANLVVDTEALDVDGTASAVLDALLEQLARRGAPGRDKMGK